MTPRDRAAFGDDDASVIAASHRPLRESAEYMKGIASRQNRRPPHFGHCARLCRKSRLAAALTRAGLSVAAAQRTANILGIYTIVGISSFLETGVACGGHYRRFSYRSSPRQYPATRHANSPESDIGLQQVAFVGRHDGALDGAFMPILLPHDARDRDGQEHMKPDRAVVLLMRRRSFRDYYFIITSSIFQRSAKAAQSSYFALARFALYRFADADGRSAVMRSGARRRMQALRSCFFISFGIALSQRPATWQSRRANGDDCACALATGRFFVSRAHRSARHAAISRPSLHCRLAAGYASIIRRRAAYADRLVNR